MKTDDKINDRPGWISLHRKSLESTVFQNVKVWYVWTWCLLKANYEDNLFLFNGKDILIKRGQFITGRTKALEEMPDLTAQTYRTSIEYLKSTNRITTKVTNRFTIITVCKYDDYQKENSQINQQNFNQSNQPLTNKQPTDNQQITTNNNLNKVNKFNKKKLPNFFNKNFSSEVNELIEDFIQQEKRDLNHDFNYSRLKKLIEKLKIIAPTDLEKIEVIKKAIATGWHTFEKLTDKEKAELDFINTIDIEHLSSG